MQWVKASERLPKNYMSVFMICTDKDGYTFKTSGFYIAENNSFQTITRNYMEVDFSSLQWLDESTDAVYAIEVPQNKLYQLYTKEQIINAHMAGQRNAGVDPSYNQALAHYEQEKKEV